LFPSQGLAREINSAIIRCVGDLMRISTRIAIQALLASTARWLQSLATCLAFLPASVVVVAFLVVTGVAQQPPQLGLPASEVSNIPKPVTDKFERVEMHNAPNDAQVGQKTIEKEDACLLPPLTLVHSLTTLPTALQIPEKAKKEYGEACAALKRKKRDSAQTHLRKAAQEYPKYSAAWVTLGQILAEKGKSDEARRACLKGSTVEPSYVPAYLCLADLAAREKAWDEVRRLSSRALELDPGTNAIAYEYNAAANLRTNKLDDAEKSALRALEIDKDHREPRVYFVLAQIYKAKGNSVKEAAQLREYLKDADSPDDVSIVKQYLLKPEKQTGIDDAINYPWGGSSTGEVWSSTGRWGPPDIDETVSPVRTDTICPLRQILKETGKRTEDLIKDLQRFSASESIEQLDIGKNGKRRNSATQVVNYIALIEQNSSSYPSVEEYRSGTNGIRQESVVDTGMASFALIFHPTHVESFDFRCEGLSELRGSPSWQVHFEERAGPTHAFQGLRIGGSHYLPRLKGRAWIATDSYSVLRIETDLVAPIPLIDLQLEHQVIVYAPVEFQKRHVRLWLPKSTSLYIVHRGHRYVRMHSFGQFQLFSVDVAIKEPNKDGPLR
jgi:tetratricopeptide (TPR) repeat protein